MDNLPSDSYPVTRFEYTEKVGALGQRQIFEVLESVFGSEKVKVANTFENGVDIQVENRIGIEVWNWSRSHAYYSRAKSVIRNLADFLVKILICSFVSKPMKAYIESFGVKVIELGFMVIPKGFLPFYVKRKMMKGKRVYSKRTLKLLRNILMSKIPQLFKKLIMDSAMLSAYVYQINKQTEKREKTYGSIFSSHFENETRTWKQIVRVLESVENNNLEKDALNLNEIFLLSKNNSLILLEKGVKGVNLNG